MLSNSEQPFRKLAVAKKCQLLIGSFDGSTRACPCYNNSECHLTDDERIKYRDDSAVIREAQANREEYQALQTKENENAIETSPP